MLAELAATNAAFSIIKSTVQNTGNLTKVANKITEYSVAKQSIEKQAREDRSAGKSGSDLVSFMALEEIEKQEIHFKELMIWAGLPRLWDDWLSSKHRPMFSGNRKKLNARLGRLSYTTSSAYQRLSKASLSASLA